MIWLEAIKNIICVIWRSSPFFFFEKFTSTADYVFGLTSFWSKTAAGLNVADPKPFVLND